MLEEVQERCSGTALGIKTELPNPNVSKHLGFIKIAARGVGCCFMP